MLQRYGYACLGFFLALCCTPSLSQTPAGHPQQPSVLIWNTGISNWPARFVDYAYLRELHAKGFNIEASEGTTVTWERLKQFNCVVLYTLPAEKGKEIKGTTLPGPPYKPEFLALLQRYLQAGGGVLLDASYDGRGEAIENLFAEYLAPWDARLPHERVIDPTTQATLPRLQNQPFIYADVVPSPVSDGVKGVWFPCGTGGYNWEQFGGLIEVGKAWTEVLRGSPTSTTEPLKPIMAQSPAERFSQPPYTRPGGVKSPTLFAIRELPTGGRLALTNVYETFHLGGGTTWVYDRAMLDKGLNGKPSDFGRLLENTFRWLSAPSLEKGTLGGYQQDPEKLLGMTERKDASTSLAKLDVYQNPTSPGQVFRGIIGARTALSGGQGTVADYAAAAQRAGLDFVVFLEDFAQLTEPAYRQFEAECKAQSTDKLLLVPGFRIDTNLGTHLFGYGPDIPWLDEKQLAGENHKLMRIQQFDEKGLLTADDQAARNWVWPMIFVPNRNIGYYDCRANQKGTPIYNLRVFGLLGVMSYRNGKQVEDITPEYIDYSCDTLPPRACAVDLVDSPAELENAAKAGHYLTHVAAANLAQLPAAMSYWHQYGRHNMYPSQGPEIRAWAGTQRVITFAGEPFVPRRYRFRPECWVTSDVGLKEILIWSDTTVPASGAPSLNCRPVLFRRILLNGAKEFHQTFEWSYDRNREMILEVTDVKGRRAVSASCSVWGDANANWWCNDRQNSMIGTNPNQIAGLWHGPALLTGPMIPWFDCGPTWDGGPQAYIGLNAGTHPALQSSVTKDEGWWPGVGGRLMEGNCTPTMFSDDVTNLRMTCDQVYAPGGVYNAYHSMGPVFPSQGMDWQMRRTGFLDRLVGVGPVYAMWPARAGGTVTCFDTTVTFKQNQTVKGLLFHDLPTRGFDAKNQPRWVVQAGTGSPVVGKPLRLNAEAPGAAPVELLPGGYVSVVGTGDSNMGTVFNIGKEPLQLVPYVYGWFLQAKMKDQPVTAGQKTTSRVMFVLDALNQTDKTPERLEKLREYYGLTGKNGSGAIIKRGKVQAQFGTLDLTPENGVVDLEVPNPGWKLDLPLGVRFFGFNPNWTVGVLQSAGYLPSFYQRPPVVYRNLGLDDERVAFLSLYPDQAAKTHVIVGHPIQCAARDLIIEVTMLNDNPASYHVAVNNPTDKSIRTVLKKCMDLPGFNFPNTPIEVPAGGYVVVREK
ncbi:MAG TPA: hypothetical protein VGM23_17620 [Armatimonadota bacterium]|jgi:hypothetical protein